MGAPSDILLHDFFEIRGGGERLALTLAHGLKLALGYGFWTEESYDPSFRAGLVTHELGTYSRIPAWRTLKQMFAFRTRSKFLRKYDRAVYSGVGSVMAVYNHAHGRNVFYCHTPPRFVYDQADHYRSMLTPLQRPVFEQLRELIRPRYERAVQSMDVVVANSINVQQRLRRFIGVDSTVVYPAVDVEGFKWHGQGDYYLSTARLDNLKRVDLILNAFRFLPHLKLVIASGGSELKRLQSASAGMKNVQITGWIDDQKMRTLIGNAIATIYLPRDEDFGMSPVESMAAGKPVIGVDSGGLRETIVHEQTGLLLPDQPNVDTLCDAIESIDPATALAMRDACEARATQFGTPRFLNQMRDIIYA